MRKLNFYPVSLLALALSLSSMPSYAGNIYRFHDKNGVSTLSKTLPPYASQQGYEILDDKSFRVIERVMSTKESIEQSNAEQLAAPAKRLEQQEQLKQEQRKRLDKEQKIVDQNLLDIYPSVQDLIKTRDDYFAYINKQIADTNLQHDHLQQKLHQLQQAAAEKELSGKPISNKLNEQIETAQKDIVDNELHLENLQNDNLNSSHQYEHDLIRLRQLQSMRREAEADSQ
ncbi:MAG: hypothetical protein MUR51_07440 [Pseudomonadota bacterium]|nr:hypothetical protein [Pseudomonadota bacterium]